MYVCMCIIQNFLPPYFVGTWWIGCNNDLSIFTFYGKSTLLRKLILEVFVHVISSPLSSVYDILILCSFLHFITLNVSAQYLLPDIEERNIGELTIFLRQWTTYPMHAYNYVYYCVERM